MQIPCIKMYNNNRNWKKNPIIYFEFSFKLWLIKWRIKFIQKKYFTCAICTHYELIFVLISNSSHRIINYYIQMFSNENRRYLLSFHVKYIFAIKIHISHNFVFHSLYQKMLKNSLLKVSSKCKFIPIIELKIIM